MGNTGRPPRQERGDPAARPAGSCTGKRGSHAPVRSTPSDGPPPSAHAPAGKPPTPGPPVALPSRMPHPHSQLECQEAINSIIRNVRVPAAQKEKVKTEVPRGERTMQGGVRPEPVLRQQIPETEGVASPCPQNKKSTPGKWVREP